MYWVAVDGVDKAPGRDVRHALRQALYHTRRRLMLPF